MTYVTDFADQAVMLPLIAAVALTLGALGWWRGAAAWLLAVGATFASVLMLKLLFGACLGVPSLRSPSGHTAAAAMFAGGMTAIVGLDRRRVAAAAGLAVLVIGVTRLVLGEHTAPEVALGGVLGLSGALGFARLAASVPRLRLRWLFAIIVAMGLLLHGRHLNAERYIRAASAAIPFCTSLQAWWSQVV